MPVDLDAIRRNGWRQGSVLSAADSNLCPGQERIELPDGGRFLLVSHDCDIAHRGDFEPIVEFYLARPIQAEPNGNYTHAKNPRRLQIALRDPEGVVRYYELRAGDRNVVDRAWLQENVPDASLQLPVTSLRILQRWLADRYIREALPDNFNDRIAGAWKAEVVPALKENGAQITDIYVALGPWEELDPESEYEVGLIALMLDDDYDDPARRVSAGEVLAAITASLNRCDGVNVVEFNVKPRSKVSLADTDIYVRMHVDYLSLRAEM